jgi:hypothetical protein
MMIQGGKAIHRFEWQCAQPGNGIVHRALRCRYIAQQLSNALFIHRPSSRLTVGQTYRCQPHHVYLGNLGISLQLF